MPRTFSPPNNADTGTRTQVSPREHTRGDYVIATATIGLLTILSVWWSRPLAHWFLLPLAACGILAGVDVVRCLRGELDLFDPRTVIACLGFYGFFAAPILHVIWDRFGAGYDLILSSDWRPWLGAMAALNGAGLIAYRLAHIWTYRTTDPSPRRWVIDSRRFYPVFAFALALSVAGAVIYLSQLGGILGEIEAFESDKAAYVGKGWLLMLAWPLAVLSFIVLVFALSDRHAKYRRPWTAVVLLLGTAGAGHFILMGWYGSRSATVWALFWMAGIVHYWFRKLSARIAVAGMILLIAFMYFYGFYKERGRAGLEVLRSPSMWLEPKGYERDLKGLLLGDFARADSNAFILHNLSQDPAGYSYRWGLTYAGGLAILIPKSIWPDRPDLKIDAGTEAMLGKATFLTSYRVYGLSGEALLNFGPAGVVPIFALYGAALGWYRRKLHSWELSDARMALAPLFSMWFASALVSDSDNLVFAVVVQGTLVIAAIVASSVRCSVALKTATPPGSGYR
jgi:hypothetical protein